MTLSYIVLLSLFIFHTHSVVLLYCRFCHHHGLLFFIQRLRIFLVSSIIPFHLASSLLVCQINFDQWRNAYCCTCTNNAAKIVCFLQSGIFFWCVKCLVILRWVVSLRLSLITRKMIHSYGVQQARRRYQQTIKKQPKFCSIKWLHKVINYTYWFIFSFCHIQYLHMPSSFCLCQTIIFNYFKLFAMDAVLVYKQKRNESHDTVDSI